MHGMEEAKEALSADLALQQGCDEEQGELELPLELGEELDDLSLHGDVERRDRLVRHDEGRLGRIRDVRDGPDGALYLLTDARDGALVRLTPAD